LDSSKSSICIRRFVSGGKNAAGEVAADFGHLGPSGIMVGKLGAAVGCAGVTGISDAKK
jgi:hypothetical protein